MYVGIMCDGLMFAWGVRVRVPAVRHTRKVGDSETLEQNLDPSITDRETARLRPVAP